MASTRFVAPALTFALLQTTYATAGISPSVEVPLNIVGSKQPQLRSIERAAGKRVGIAAPKVAVVGVDAAASRNRYSALERVRPAPRRRAAERARYATAAGHSKAGSVRAHPVDSERSHNSATAHREVRTANRRRAADIGNARQPGVAAAPGPPWMKRNDAPPDSTVVGGPATAAPVAAVTVSVPTGFWNRTSSWLPIVWNEDCGWRRQHEAAGGDAAAVVHQHEDVFCGTVTVPPFDERRGLDRAMHERTAEAGVGVTVNRQQRAASGKPSVPLLLTATGRPTLVSIKPLSIADALMAPALIAVMSRPVFGKADASHLISDEVDRGADVPALSPVAIQLPSSAWISPRLVGPPRG